MPACEYVHIVTPAEANDIIVEKDPLILDVRTSEEYANGHIDGAINLPFDKVNEAVIAEIAGDFDKHILVYCSAGIRSAITSSRLVEMGYKNVHDLADGINAWPFGLV